MSAFNVSHEVTINHRELGADVWEWDAGKQAEFLVGFAETFAAAGGVGIMQIHYIAEELRKDPAALNTVTWLSELLAAYLAEESK
jgi:hypothetical protein